MHDYRFLTTYRKHYVKKTFRKSIQHRPTQEYPDPIAAGQKHFLHLQKPNLTPPDEDGELYIDKLKQQHAHLESLLENPLDANLIIKQEVINEKSTEYQAKFCDTEKEVALDSEVPELKLDSDIPLTTYKAGFRNPLSYTPRALDPPIRIIQPVTLGDNKRTNDLLQVKTEISEYTDGYGILGEYILSESAKKYKKGKLD